MINLNVASKKNNNMPLNLSKIKNKKPKLQKCNRNYKRCKKTTNKFGKNYPNWMH